jgi:hypothetical protein
MVNRDGNNGWHIFIIVFLLGCSFLYRKIIRLTHSNNYNGSAGFSKMTGMATMVGRDGYHG